MLRYVCVMGPISDPTEFQWHAQLCTSRHTFTYKHHQLPIEILTPKINNKRPSESSKVLFGPCFAFRLQLFFRPMLYLCQSAGCISGPRGEAARRKICIDFLEIPLDVSDRNRFPVSMVHFELLEMDVSAVSKGFKTGFQQIYLDHFIKFESAAVGDRSKRKKQVVTKP